jgi:hypothetical protein
VDQLSNSSEKRLARALLILAHFEGTSEPLVPQINQGTLAEMIGTTRSRVNFHEPIQKTWLHSLQCKRPKCMVLLSVHEWVKWTLPQERSGCSRAAVPRCG